MFLNVPKMLMLNIVNGRLYMPAVKVVPIEILRLVEALKHFMPGSPVTE